MKTLIRSLLALSAAGISALAQNNGMNAVHPGYTVTDIQPTGRKFLVGGLDTFSDGRLAVCNWGNPGDVWIVGNAEKGTAATVQPVRFATGLRQVLGCKVVRDTLYVMQMDELTQLVDTDKDGKADAYNKVNDAFSASESNLGYAFDVAYHAGAFYAALSADVQIGGMDFNPSLSGRSLLLRLHRDNKTEVLSSGFRNPNGMAKGFGNRLFAVDNQGSWTPSSKILHLQEGKFYGHKNNVQTQFQDLAETWPMVWLPHGDVSTNPGNLLFISEGLFKNQFFFTDLGDGLRGRIYRISVQEVDGVMQGAVLPFSSSYGVGSSRLAWGPNNTLYAGELGSSGGWSNLASLKPGLKRIAGPADINKSQVFEILAVRSTGPTTLELEFTEAVAADANQVGKYTIRKWTFQPQQAYGGGNQVSLGALTAQSAVVKPDGKTVELTIPGMQEKYLIHIRLNALTSSTGQAAWTTQTWFTLNKFGPGTVPPIAGCRNTAFADYDPKATVDDPKSCVVPAGGSTSIQPFAVASRSAAAGPVAYLGRGRIRLELPVDAPYALTLSDVAGRTVKTWRGKGPADIDGSEALGQGSAQGVHFLTLRSGHRSWSRAVLSSL